MTETPSFTGRDVRGGLIKLSSRSTPEAGSLHTQPVHGKAHAAHPSWNVLDVLLVEDNAGDAGLVSYWLRQSDKPRFNVTHVDSLARARTHLKTKAADVVLLDLTLPDSIGIDTLGCLRDEAPLMPIVVMTGLSDPSSASHALEMGAQDYLVKSDDGGPTIARAIRYAMSRMAAQIERQTLIATLENEKAAMRRELNAARTMQFNLLPPDSVGRRLNELGLAVESYFEPSSAIGGDLWGCLDNGPNQIVFFVFDFSGHGISAALNVFRLHTLLREHREPTDDPAAMLAALNLSLCDLLPKGQYATMFLGIVDTARDELVWSAAGHPEPAILTADGNVELIDTRGMLLGISPTAVYHTRRRHFPPGSGIFIYSDAMTEAMDHQDQMVGEARLAELLRRSRRDGGPISLPLLLDEFFAMARPPIEDDLTALSITRL